MIYSVMNSQPVFSSLRTKQPDDLPMFSIPLFGPNSLLTLKHFEVNARTAEMNIR